MQLGWYDRTAPHKTYTLPRNPGEPRIEYTKRFFGELRHVGNIAIVTTRGQRRTVRARRGF